MIQEESTKEFDKFQSFIYLDWCVFSDLAHILEHIEGKKYKFENIICEYLKDFIFDENYCFPYSEGHLQDITRGNGEKHKDFENRATGRLQKLSRGWKISEDSLDHEKARVDKCLDMFEDVVDTRKAQSFVKSTQDLYWSFVKPVINNKSKTQNQINPKYFLPSDSINSWDSFIKSSYEYLIDHSLERNTNISAKIPFMSRMDIIEFINNKLLNSDYQFKSIDEYEKVFTNNNFHKNISKFSSEVNKISCLCDIVGLTHESSKASTFPYNLITDTSPHLTLGLRANAFFTKDKQLIYKAIICKRWLDLSVNIFLIENYNCILY